MRAAALILAALALALAPAKVGADATREAVGFICGAEHTAPAAGPVNVVLEDGIGNDHWAIRTANPVAQRWFDYGLNLYHAFYHDEAKAAFRKAMAFDPECAMCAWGEALSLGATLNYPISADQTAEALKVAQRAQVLAANDDAKIRALTAALVTRYSPAAGQGEAAFRREMDAIAARWPTDHAVADVTAHVIMIPSRADDFSTVPRAMAILEGVLKRRPDDTAAIHYYIHATEFAGRPALALPYAERLASLAPRASHLVHMGAHTFIHVGGYERAALVNAQALDVDAEFGREMGYVRPLGAAMYYPHNISFGTEGALMAGDATLALRFADDAKVAFPDSVNRRAYALSRSFVAYARFAPDKALAIPASAAGDGLLAIYRHYARGEAFAARGDVAGVVAEAAALKAMKLAPADAANLPHVTVAVGVLSGRAEMLQGRPDLAASSYAQAAAVQETAFGKSFDPPPWWYPVRRSQAAALLAAGRDAEAVAAAEKSLAGWPADGLALRVLGEAQAKLGRAAGARRDRDAARSDYRGDPAALPLALI